MKKVKQKPTQQLRKAFSVGHIGGQRGTEASERRRHPRKSTFLGTLDWVLALCAWAFLSLQLCSLAVAFFLNIFLSTEQLSSTLWTTIYNALAYTLALLMTVLAPYKIVKFYKNRPNKTNQKSAAENSKASNSPAPSSLAAKPSREQLGLTGLPTWVDILLSPVGFIIYLIAATTLTALFAAIFPWFDASQSQDVGYSSYLAGTDMIIAFIALVVIAPVAEEIIFRGWLYGKLRSRLNLPLAVIIVSLLFAALHGQWNVAVNVFALSVVLCALREITGTIYSGILLHMLKNGIAFWLLYVVYIG